MEILSIPEWDSTLVLTGASADCREASTGPVEPVEALLDPSVIWTRASKSKTPHCSQTHLAWLAVTSLIGVSAMCKTGHVDSRSGFSSNVFRETVPTHLQPADATSWCVGEILGTITKGLDEIRDKGATLGHEELSDRLEFFGLHRGQHIVIPNLPFQHLMNV